MLLVGANGEFQILPKGSPFSRKTIAADNHAHDEHQRIRTFLSSARMHSHESISSIESIWGIATYYIYVARVSLECLLNPYSHLAEVLLVPHVLVGIFGFLQ